MKCRMSKSINVKGLHFSVAYFWNLFFRVPIIMFLYYVLCHRKLRQFKWLADYQNRKPLELGRIRLIAMMMESVRTFETLLNIYQVYTALQPRRQL
jgi:hypothetical protein